MVSAFLRITASVNMSANDWEEVKRLAADFQRAQLSSGVQRLSERNCIEIINKLIEEKKLEVVFTTDGKEYITPQHLIKEIKDELFVHNGRINLVDLAKALSVDLSVITAKAAEIEKSSGSISVINGQLIDNSYLLSICEEINEKLKMKGQVTIAELTSQYDLPGNYLATVIEKQLGKIIKAFEDKSDRHVFYTEDFRRRNLSVIRGALLALTKPTSVSTLLSLSNVDEKLFYSVIGALNDSKELPGTVTGKDGSHSTYVPSVYQKSQLEWVTNFLSQNGYLEYTALSRLGIPNPVPFIKKHFPDSNLLMLGSCAVGPFIVDQVEAAIEEVISTASFVNVLPLLPSVAEDEDAELIVNSVLKKKAHHNLRVFNSVVVVTDQYLRNLAKKFEQEVEKKGRECVSSGLYLKHVLSQEKPAQRNCADEEKHEARGDRKEERRKKAVEGKGGGGALGRETKTKSTKKKYMKHAQEDSDEEERGKGKRTGNQKLELISLQDVKEIVGKDELLREEDSEELVESIAETLLPRLQQSALEAAKAFYDSTIAATNQGRRKKHHELEEKLNDLVLKVRLFEKGYKQFPSKEVQQQLAKYLLKTICTDVANEVFSYVVQDEGKFQGKEMTNELRAKVVASASNELRETLTSLNKSLASSSVEDFLNVIDVAVGPGFCDILLKKFDKKTERAQLVEQRQQLVDQLNVADDPALVLHLASLILFQEVTQTMVHASGRFVSTILAFLQPSLPPDDFHLFQEYHDSVLKVLSTSDSEKKSEAEKILQEKMPSIKTITVSFKKS